jgi:hypothetical protein
MKKKSSLVSYLAAILLFGVISSLFNSELPFREIFDSLELNNIEVLLEYLSLGLAFLTFGILFIVLIVRATRTDENLYWDFQADDFKEDQ